MRIAFLALFAVASLLIADAETIHEKIVDEKRFVVFNSRQLTGECLPICVEDTPAPSTAPTKAPTISPTQNPTVAPSEDVVQNAPPAGCPYVNFDFSDLSNGDWIHDQFWESKCVKVTAYGNKVGTAKNQRAFTPIDGTNVWSGGAARVFDTGNKNNCDADLMTPSPKFYNGPDVNCGNCCGKGPYKMKKTSSGCQYLYENGQKIPNPYKNDEYLGNVLIIQEYHAKGSDALEMNSCPDDTGKGGYIEFEFCQPVTLNAGRLLDVDGSESADIYFYYSDGTSKKYDVGTTGDNGYWRYDYEEDDVVSVKFEYTGSGSVEGVEYWYCPEDETETDEPTDSPTKSPTPNPTPNPTPQPTPNPTPQPTPNPTPSPTKDPTAAPTEDVVQNAPPAGCPEVNFDFSELSNGDWLYDQFWDTKCVKVTAFAAAPGGRKGFTPINGVHNVAGGAARVFDTGNRNNCDSDLMTPSPKFYNGPDVNCGDCCGGGPYKMKHTSSGCQYLYENGQKIPNPYKNDKYLGNVLIIQEKSNGNEMNSCPDDTGRGGYIMFEFCKPVTVQAGRLLDVDGAESADIVFHYANGSSYKYDVGTTGDNGYWRYDYLESNVEKVVFEYTGSGSVEGLNYWYCPDP